MLKIFKFDIVFYIFLLFLGTSSFLFALNNPITENFYIFVILMGLSGIGVTCYIRFKKISGKHLACPTGSNCDVVIKSKFSKFLKIPLEYWGLLYYLTIISSYSSFIINPSLTSTILLPLVFGLTCLAFLFSFYLLFIQGFILKEWCIWCLLSAFLSISIFLVTLVSFETIIQILLPFTPIIFIIKDLGYLIGIGGATVLSFLFFKYLDDFNINFEEAETLKSFTEVIWTGLGLIIMSNYLLYSLEFQNLSLSSIFYAEIIALLVVLISGAIFKVILSPYLVVLPFEKKESSNKNISLQLIQKITLITGAIALSSWYFSFLIDYINEYTDFSLFNLYGLIILISILIALIVNIRFTKK
ncbi:MAG: vitamin K epoxide reductase family protein [Candidatus Paceibacterota bacterium]